MEMFPESSRDHLSSCLTRHASVANAALSLSATSAMQSGDNDGDANLAEPAFSPPKIEDKPVCLSSLLEELSRNVSSKRVKLKVDEMIYSTTRWRVTRTRNSTQRRNLGLYTITNQQQTREV